MKIDVDEEGTLILKEVYNSIILETSEGNRFVVCMRDDTFEMKVLTEDWKNDIWYRANIETRKIEEEKIMIGEKDYYSDSL